MQNIYLRRYKRCHNHRIMEHFKTATFDYILIDEAHRSAAPSYQRILNYFKPKFCLGMTATPERTDEEDVFSIFDYNLACEIRLNDALKENMLAPFHYVGIQDYELDGQTSDDFSKLRFLTTDARVDYILKELNYYGYCGDMPRGLVFCSRQEEAQALAEAFSKKGHKAVALTNRDSRTKRHKVVNDLEIGKIEYIITVDLFNEGIDIPSLNQIVMLRNTQSSIVFIQQLGRGLRKYPGKDFVTIIDFIGNYKNNYLIPIALNDDISRDKDQVRRETQLPQLIGVSTINFRQVAAEKILNSLNAIKLDGLTELRKAYIDLKHKLGRSPLLMDFEKFGSVSPIVFAKNHNLANYAVFLKKMGEKLVLSEYQGQILTFITKELLNGKRKHELLLLKLLLEKKQCTFDEFEQELKKTNSYIDQAVLDSVMAILSLSFFDVKAGKSTKKEQYGNTPLVEKCNLLDYKLNEQLQESLQTNSDFKRLFVDVITTGLRLSEAYKGQYQFTLYKQYNRKDVCRLLNWPLDVSAPMYGYRVTDNECPIFITYQKDDSKKRNSIYQNTLENGQILRWYTRTPRHLESAEVQKLLAGVDSGKPKVKIHLFVKQSDAVGKEFFYLGTAKIQKDSVKEEKLGLKKNKVAVGMNLELTHSLSPNMYEMLFDDLLL